jgi:hypothetical protein
VATFTYVEKKNSFGSAGSTKNKFLDFPIMIEWLKLTGQTIISRIFKFVFVPKNEICTTAGTFRANNILCIGWIFIFLLKLNVIKRNNENVFTFILYLCLLPYKICLKFIGFYIPMCILFCIVHKKQSRCTYVCT